MTTSSMAEKFLMENAATKVNRMRMIRVDITPAERGKGQTKTLFFDNPGIFSVGSLSSVSASKQQTESAISLS